MKSVLVETDVDLCYVLNSMYTCYFPILSFFFKEIEKVKFYFPQKTVLAQYVPLAKV